MTSSSVFGDLLECTEGDALQLDMYGKETWTHMGISEANQAFVAEKDKLEDLEILIRDDTETDTPVALLIRTAELPGRLKSFTVSSQRSENGDWDMKDKIVFELSPAIKNVGMLMLYNIGMIEGSDPFCRFLFKQLEMTDCRFRGGVLPDTIWHRELTNLRIWETPIGSLPNGMAGSPLLKDLLVHDCGISELPAEISGMEYLEDVSLDGNLLSEIPRIPSLQKGRFRRNRITEIPEWATERKFYVNIHGNPIQQGMSQAKASEDEFVYRHLRRYSGGCLDLSRNLIKAVPPWHPRRILADFTENDIMSRRKYSKVCAVRGPART